jgi:hypothetical protein
MKQIFKASLLFTFVLFSCSKKDKLEEKKPTDTIKKDTAKVANKEDKEDMEKNGFYAEENYVIANKTFVRVNPSANAASLDTLDFGTLMYTKNVYYAEEGNDISGDASKLIDEKKNGYVAVYNKKPTKLSDKPFGFVLESVLAYEYEYQEFKKYFSLPEFKKLDSKVKKAILDNSYLDGKTYKLTQNSNKAKNAVVTGDFDQDGLKDYAVVQENIENEYSLVTVFLMNKATKDPYVAYRSSFSEFLNVSLIKKNTNISYYDNGEETETITNNDVIALTGDGTKSYLFYNTVTNKFDLR